MFNITPNDDGSRSVAVKSAYLELAIDIAAMANGPVRIIDSAGNEVGSGTVKALTPELVKNVSVVNDDQQTRVDARKAICGPCDQNLGMSLYTVNCNGCGCAQLSLLNGVCKLNKWPIFKDSQ